MRVALFQMGTRGYVAFVRADEVEPHDVIVAPTGDLITISTILLDTKRSRRRLETGGVHQRMQINLLDSVMVPVIR
jgi:hypothetical protein